MAIFGNVTLVVPNWAIPGTFTTLGRAETHADMALNHFFSGVFTFYFITGVILSPLTARFCYQLSYSPSNLLLALVAIIDSFKLFYFPLMLVPKLLAPPEEMELYYKYKTKWEDPELGWSATLNTIVQSATGIEVYVIVLTIMTRYMYVKNFSVPDRVVYFFSYTVIFFVSVMCFTPLFLFDHKIIYKFRITQAVLSNDTVFLENVYKPAMKCQTIVMLMFFVFGLVAGILTTVRLVKNLECPDRQFQQCINRMNTLNMMVLAVTASFLIVFAERAKENPPKFSTPFDFFIFSVTFGIPLTQSFWNTVSIFRMPAFREEMLFRKVTVQQDATRPTSPN